MKLMTTKVIVDIVSSYEELNYQLTSGLFDVWNVRFRFETVRCSIPFTVTFGIIEDYYHIGWNDDDIILKNYGIDARKDKVLERYVSLKKEIMEKLKTELLEICQKERLRLLTKGEMVTKIKCFGEFIEPFSEAKKVN